MRELLEKFDSSTSVKGLFSLFLAILFLFCAFPAVNTEAAIDTNPDDTKPIVVSLGDSYSAGEGIEKFYDQDLKTKDKVKSFDWLAHRSQKSWPGMLEIPGLDRQTSHYKGTNWYFMAVSGAMTKHLTYQQEKEYTKGAVGNYKGTEYLPAQFDIFKELEPNSVDYVTMTMGGNDADFAEIIKTAAIHSSYVDKNKLTSMLNGIWARYYKDGGIRDDLYDAYKEIEKRAGTQAQIIIAGYPQLLEPNGKGLPINKIEATEINRAVSNFNIAIEEIVEQCSKEGMKICFVSVESEFEGHEAYSSNPYINEVILGTKDEDLKDLDVKSAYSIHPNYNGAIAYAECVNKKIKLLAEEAEEKMEEEALNPSEKEREVALVLDASGSMAGNPLTETKKAAYKFVNTVLGAEANIGIVGYDDVATMYSTITDSEAYLKKRIDEINAGGSTNIEDGLKMAANMLAKSDAKRKIIVLMSDGIPNCGKTGSELIDYAQTLKDNGYYIYTLGFFSALSQPASAIELMSKIASEGCHYEVSDAESLVFFFGDIADQISGENYIYVRIACPVDVTVSYDGETMSSKSSESNIRTSFGTMTFEEAESDEDADTDKDYDDEDGDNDNRVKILRLKEGVDYNIEIEGNGKGRMNYDIGFMDADGEYTDMRRFSNIKINRSTEIKTVATRSKHTYMYVDEDGDGKYDLTYRAEADSRAELVDNSWIVYTCLAVIAGLIVLILFFVLKRRFKIKRYLTSV